MGKTNELLTTLLAALQEYDDTIEELDQAMHGYLKQADVLKFRLASLREDRHAIYNTWNTITAKAKGEQDVKLSKADTGGTHDH